MKLGMVLEVDETFTMI